MRLLTVLGARPQFIKAAAVSRAIAAHNRDHPERAIHEEIIHTGQHYDHGMSQVFFDEMEIPAPAVNLNIGSGTHGAMTGDMLAGLEREMLQRQPDQVLVYGDTNSTLAGALAAVKLHIPVAHVEAGLRSFNRAMPEEINRIVADHVADLLLCPCENARRQLEKEGVTRGVHVIGDVMYDAFLHYQAKAIDPGRPGPFALATIHRAENTDDPARLANILHALERAPVPVVLPLHPRTRNILERQGFRLNHRVELREPFSYYELLGHLLACAFVITDSGGLQKEAYFAGKKCITAREQTEWVELTARDVNRLGGDLSRDLDALNAWALSPGAFHEKLYGEGHASQICIDTMLQA
ncbi:MAG: non-hydrolyzing UDP-N-acetylglucosamine 2-epimerase [bacterium]